MMGMPVPCSLVIAVCLQAFLYLLPNGLGDERFMASGHLDTAPGHDSLVVGIAQHAMHHTDRDWAW